MVKISFCALKTCPIKRQQFSICFFPLLRPSSTNASPALFFFKVNYFDASRKKKNKTCSVLITSDCVDLEDNNVALQAHRSTAFAQKAFFRAWKRAGAVIGIYGSRVYGVLCVVKHNYSVLLQQLARRQEPELYPIRPPQTGLPYTNVCAASRALFHAACQVGCVAELPNYCTAFSLYRGVRAELMMAKCCSCWGFVAKM